MSRRMAAWAAAAMLVVAACSAGAATRSTASASASASPFVLPSSPVASTEARSPAPSSAPRAAVACSVAAGVAGVAISIEDFAFKPDVIAANVGQVIAFTNTGFESHNATVEGGGCATRTLRTGDHDGLVFTAAGSHRFNCSIHTWMTGMITVTG